MLEEWVCPRGHKVSGADLEDLWCPDCGEDVVVFRRAPAGKEADSE